MTREDRHTKVHLATDQRPGEGKSDSSVWLQNLVWSKALSVFAGSQKRLDHFGVYEVAVERVQLVEPEIEP